jgi:exocyst complex component 2
VHVFHYLENWALSSSEPYTTEYLSHIQFFQRQVTTWAFKFASGAEASSSSSRLGRRPIPNEFVIKITKAFVDSTYAFLDGQVLLAEQGSPITDSEKIPSIDAGTAGSLQALGLLDTSDVVRLTFTSTTSPHSRQSTCKDTRTLLVISNFGYLKRGLIPSMINQFESAFNVTIDTDKAVSKTAGTAGWVH